MNDLEPYQQPSNLTQWANEARAAAAIAASVCKTSFVPKHYRGKVEESTAAIMRGAELGLSPLAALSSLVDIQGTPALTAMALRAVVQSHGHTVWVVESSDKKAVARGRRRGEDVTHESTWTIQRAERLGLTGKDNWRKQPEAMLIARATSEICRLVASDAILGLGYSVEELSDDAPPEPARTVRRKPPEPAALPSADLPGHEAVLEQAVKDVKVTELAGVITASPELAAEMMETAPLVEAGVQRIAETLGGEVIDVEPVETDPAADVMTQPQRAALHASFKDAGITDRKQRLNYASEVVGRTLATSAELTKAEASDVIDALKQEAKND